MHTHSILTENGIKYKPSEPKVLGGGPKHFDPDGRKDAPGVYRYARRSWDRRSSRPMSFRARPLASSSAALYWFR